MRFSEFPGRAWEPDPSSFHRAPTERAVSPHQVSLRFGLGRSTWVKVALLLPLPGVKTKCQRERDGPLYFPRVLSLLGAPHPTPCFATSGSAPSRQRLMSPWSRCRCAWAWGQHARPSHRGPWTAARSSPGWAPGCVCFRHIHYHLDTEHNMAEAIQWNSEFVARKIKPIKTVINNFT